jgi:hypothetical protein
MNIGVLWAARVHERAGAQPDGAADPAVPLPTRRQRVVSIDASETLWSIRRMTATLDPAATSMSR